MKRVNFFLILSCLFAKSQAVELEAPAVAQQAAAVQQWQSIFGTHYPIIEEIKSIYLRDCSSLNQAVNTIVFDKMKYVPKYLENTVRQSGLLERDVLDLAVFYFNNDKHYHWIRRLPSKPSVPDLIVNSAIGDKVCTIAESAINNRFLCGGTKWPSLTKIRGDILHYSNAFGASQYADFKSFLTNKQPEGWDLDQTWPAEWKLEELNTYYKEVVQKVPYVLALIGECYTHKNDTSQLNKQIKRVYQAFQDRLLPADKKIICQYFDQTKDNFLTDIRTMSKFSTKALREQEKIQKFGISYFGMFLEIFQDVAHSLPDVVNTQFGYLKKSLASIKEMVPTSTDFIDGIKEKIASIDAKKRTRVLRLNKDFFDHMLTADKDTVANCWHDEKNLKGWGIMSLIHYTTNHDRLDFGKPSQHFIHDKDGSWSVRNEVVAGRTVNSVYKFTSEEQDFIVRDLLERNVLTPLRNVGLITDHTEEEKKEEEVPVENIISAAKNEYSENKKNRKQALKKALAEKKDQPNDKE